MKKSCAWAQVVPLNPGPRTVMRRFHAEDGDTEKWWSQNGVSGDRSLVWTYPDSNLNRSPNPNGQLTGCSESDRLIWAKNYSWTPPQTLNQHVINGLLYLAKTRTGTKADYVISTTHKTTEGSIFCSPFSSCPFFLPPITHVGKPHALHVLQSGCSMDGGLDPSYITVSPR